MEHTDFGERNAAAESTEACVLFVGFYTVEMLTWIPNREWQNVHPTS